MAGVLHAGVSFEPSADRLAFSARAADAFVTVRSNGVEWISGGRHTSLEMEGARDESGRGGQVLPGVTHYVIGDDSSRWRWNVPHYAEALFRSVYPGVDLRYHSDGSRIEFDFQIAPNGLASQIRLQFPETVRLSADGALHSGETALRRPQGWQIIEGQRKVVDISFALAGAHRARFRLGPYRRELPLTIDPVIDFATFLGGSGNETSTSVMTGPDGAVYVAGTTTSADFPASLPSGNPLNRPVTLLVSTAYISRMRPDGSALDWSLFIGGTAQQSALDLKRDAQGNVYLLGGTSSPNFPVTSGAYQTHLSPAGSDLFVVKFDGPSGRVLASTFLGIGTRLNPPGPTAHLAVDSTGGIYIGGPQLDTTFKPTPGTLPGRAFNGDSTAASSFLLRLNTSCTAAVYATYVPMGSITAMDVDAAGEVTVGGAPLFGALFVGVNPIPSIDPGTGFLTAYIAKINAGAIAILFSSLLEGHNGRDADIEDIKIDLNGNINVLGYASGDSFPQVNPLTIDPLPANYPPPDGLTDSPFLVKLPPSGVSLMQSTWFRGPAYTASSLGQAQQLVMRPNGSFCLAGIGSGQFQQTTGGLTASGNTNLPQPATMAVTTVACIDDTGSNLSLKTGIPGGTFTSVASTPDDALILAGTSFASLPTTPGAYQPVFAGGVYTPAPFNAFPSDAFLLRMSFQNPAPQVQSIFPSSVLLNGVTQANLQVDLYGTGFASGATVAWDGAAVNSAFLTANHMVIPAIPISSIQPGANNITVSLPGPGGGTSSIAFQGINAGPFLVGLSPATVTQGSGETKLLITGTHITSGSVLNWNGTPRSATFVNQAPSPAHLEVLLEPAELSQPFSASVTVTNPGPGGGTSPPSTFSVIPAGAVTPGLTVSDQLLTFGPSLTLGPQIQFNGSGFGSGMRAFWDGTEIPAQFVSTSVVKLTPPSNDLQHVGTHSLYVQNGQAPSATIAVSVGYAGSFSFSTADPNAQRLYVLSNSAPGSSSTYDLAIFNLLTGDFISAVPAIVTSPAAIAVSDDGQFVYLASGNATTLSTIYRYNTALANIDLSWQIPMPTTNNTSYQAALLTVTGSPETVVVASLGVLTIYDRDQPRWSSTAYPVHTFLNGTPKFATSSRIYVSSSTSGCWTTLDFDPTGIIDVPATCVAQPDGMVQDGVLGYLTDGKRVFGVSLPNSGPLSNNSIAVAAVDIARRRAYGTIPSQYVTQFDLDTQAQTTRPYVPGYMTTFSVNSSGSVLMNTGSVIMFLP